jgi:hypothetical protein
MQLKSRSAAEQWLSRYFFANSSTSEGQNEVEQDSIQRFTAELSHDEAVTAWVLQEAEAGPLELVRNWTRVLAQCASLEDDLGINEAPKQPWMRSSIEEQAIAVLGELQSTLVWPLACRCAILKLFLHACVWPIHCAAPVDVQWSVER